MKISKRAFLHLCAAAGATSVGNHALAQMPVNGKEILWVTLAGWWPDSGHLETVVQVMVVGDQVNAACLTTVEVMLGGIVQVEVALVPGTETWFWHDTEYDLADADELHLSFERFSELQLGELVSVLEGAEVFANIGHAPSGAVTWSKGSMDRELIAFGRHYQGDNWYLGFEADPRGGYIVVFGTSAAPQQPTSVPLLLGLMLDGGIPLPRAHDTSDADWIFEDYYLQSTMQSVDSIDC